MQFIGKLINLTLFLALFLVISFVAAYMIPAYLQNQYRLAYQQIYVSPKTSAGTFDEWANASDAALNGFNEKHTFMQWLAVLTYPGHRPAVYQLAEELRESSADFQVLLGDMRQLLQENPLLRHTWEKAILENAKASSENESITHNVLQSITNFVSTVEDTGDILKRYMLLQEKLQAIQQRLDALKNNLNADKASLRIGA